MFVSFIEKPSINITNELGFDSRILSESIKKALEGIELELYDKNSIANAINFFNSIISYCDRKHTQTKLGLSGAEAFKIFVNSVSNFKSIQEVKNANVKNVELLRGIIEGRTNNGIQDELLKVVTSLSNYQKDTVQQSFLDNLGW